jgi:virginiamycin B lyase
MQTVDKGHLAHPKDARMAQWIERIANPCAIIGFTLAMLDLIMDVALVLAHATPQSWQRVFFAISPAIALPLALVSLGATIYRWVRIARHKQTTRLGRELQIAMEAGFDHLDAAPSNPAAPAPPSHGVAVGVQPPHDAANKTQAARHVMNKTQAARHVVNATQSVRHAVNAVQLVFVGTATIVATAVVVGTYGPNHVINGGLPPRTQTTVSTTHGRPTPTPFGPPHFIATVTDAGDAGYSVGGMTQSGGAVWFTETSSDGSTIAIGRIIPQSTTSRYALQPQPLLSAGGPTTAIETPSAIAPGPGGLWFAESGANTGSGDQRPSRTTIGQITAQGKEAIFPLNGDIAVTALVAGPDGNLWFPENSGFSRGVPFQGRIGQLTPSGQLHEFSVGQDHMLAGIALGADNNLWFTDSLAPIDPSTGFPNAQSNGKIGRITPAGQITEFALPDPNDIPNGIVAGTDGNLWFITSQISNASVPSSDGKIGRITPQGHITLFPLPATHGATVAIAVASSPDGNVWFIIQAAPGSSSPPTYSIGWMTPQGQLHQMAIPTGTNLAGNAVLALGPDAAMWVTIAGNGPSFMRITV